MAVKIRCESKGCRNSARKGRKICSTCNKRQWRVKYPMKASYETLKGNAKRRGKIFELTFEEFKDFCYETNYMAGKGRSKLSFSVDCVIPGLGYVRSNIQKLTVSDNSKKKNKILMYDWETRTAKVI